MEKSGKEHFTILKHVLPMPLLESLVGRHVFLVLNRPLPVVCFSEGHFMPLPRRTAQGMEAYITNTIEGKLDYVGEFILLTYANPQMQASDPAVPLQIAIRMQDIMAITVIRPSLNLPPESENPPNQA